MMWTPTQRALSSALPPLSRLRGVCPCELMAWPDAALLSGNDYSVDFSDQIADGDRIVRVAATPRSPGTLVAWVSIFGTKATAWVQWSSSGPQSIAFDALTASGATLNASGYVAVGCSDTGLAPDIPQFAPNAFRTGDVIMPDSNGNPLIFG